jgi:microsomal dipeptidase-like Zn-dependent dipeptidase
MKINRMMHYCFGLGVGLLLTQQAGAFSQPPPAEAPVEQRQDAEQAVHELAQGCYAIQSPANGKFINRYHKGGAIDDGLGWQVKATSLEQAASFYFKPTSFFHFMLTDKDGRYLATHLPNEISAGRYAGEFAEFKVTAHPQTNGGFFYSFYGPKLAKVIRHNYGSTGHYREGGVYVIDLLNPNNSGSESQFRLVQKSDCTPFPEAQVNVSGDLNALKGDVELPVRGSIDLHTHITSYEFMGGKFLHGEPFHRWGIETALRDSKEIHGPNGSLDIIGNLMGYDDVNHRYDTRGWPDFPFWPNRQQVSHMQYYYKWIERAHRGGVRMMVTHLVENEVLCNVQKTVNPASWINPNNCNTMASIHLQIRRLKEMQDYIDAQQGGPGKGFFRLVTLPQQAREVIADGKMAILMGIEASELFNCGLKDSCSKESIERQLMEVYDAGVRVMYPVHRFDNQLGGARQEDGFINVGQWLSSGRFFETEECDDETRGQRFTSGFPLLSDVPVIGDILKGIGLSPEYDESRLHCNRHGLTSLGEYLVERMMDLGMIIELDHTSTRTGRAIMDLLEARQYHGVVTGHSHLNRKPDGSAHELHHRIARAGGMLAPYNSASSNLEWSISEFIDLKSSTGHWVGVPFSTDMGGIGSQAWPRDDVDSNPLQYPFMTEFGQTIDRQQTGNRVFDLNQDGLAHFGLVADHIQDIRENTSTRIYEAVMNSAEAYLQMWENAIANGSPKYAGAAGTYVSIVDRNSGRCMDIPGNDDNLNNGVSVQLWDCQLTSQDQKWRYDREAGMFRNKANPEKCLDNRGQAHDNGEIVIWDCIDSDNLRWDYQGNKLASRHNSNIVADAYGTANGANVGQWTYHGGSNQQWELRVTEPRNAWVQYRSEATGQCITAQGDHVDAVVSMAACDGSDAQQWRYDSGTGLVINGQAGELCLGIPNGMIYDHTPLQLEHCNANADHQRFSYAGNMLRAQLDANQVLDVAGGGSQLIMFSAHGKANQRWHGTLH